MNPESGIRNPKTETETEPEPKPDKKIGNVMRVLLTIIAQGRLFVFMFLIIAF